MFEVPTTSVKTERGSCGRNCFNCPLCGCIATVANATAPEDRLLLTDDSSYVPTLHLGSGAGYGSSFDRYGLGAAASTAYMHSALLDPSIRSMRIKPDKRAVAYEPLLKPSGQSIDPVAQINQIPYEKPALNKDFGTLMVLQFCKCEFPIATMDSGRSAVIQQLRPVRVQLRSKRTKRCLGCEHILVKPEIKAASIRFGIKMTARRRSHSMLPPSYKSTPHAIQVHLEHPEDPPSICLMHIHEPRFTLAAFSDSWELHEPSSYGASDSVSDAQSQLDGTVAPVDACAVAGPHERLIVISFTPTAPVSEIQLLIKVTFSTQPKDDMPQGISDPGVAHNEDLGSDKVVDNEISFWVVVGVGSSGSTSIEKDYDKCPDPRWIKHRV
ncbi:hypothetical protein BSLG_000015 [Batrachochytrium salamandrivorans]|nr:hypothetical protein BSLG_000015 [Batrachochytrium salamandrivorans]